MRDDHDGNLGDAMGAAKFLPPPMWGDSVVIYGLVRLASVLVGVASALSCVIGLM